MSLAKVFDEKRVAVLSAKEKDPSLRSMTELLSIISKMKGKQRSFYIQKYIEVFAQKFSIPTVVDRNGTKIWNLFSEVSRKVLNEGCQMTDADSKTIYNVLDVGQRCTVEGVVVPNIPEDLISEYKSLSNSYNGKFAPEVREAMKEISLILT